MGVRGLESLGSLPGIHLASPGIIRDKRTEISVLSGGIFWLFGSAMPRRTSKGGPDPGEDLRLPGVHPAEFIRRVEQDRLERLLGEAPNLFDRVPPYALVSGVADEWAREVLGAPAEAARLVRVARLDARDVSASSLHG